MGEARIDLVWIGDAASPPDWTLGTMFPCAADPHSLSRLVTRELPESEADGWLFWDAGLGPPSPTVIGDVLNLPGDLWHAGLRLGLSGLPRAIDHVAPTWMLNRDPDPEIEATSWRLSFRSCLARTHVLQAMGPPSGGYRTLAGTSLDYGHRCVRRGVFCRHVPWLAPAASQPDLPLEDELRFVRSRFGTVWTRWAIARAVGSRSVGMTEAARAFRALRGEPVPEEPRSMDRTAATPRAEARPAAVTVLIPTVDRYPYLRTLLEQLGGQTVAPAEILVVDQTPLPRRQSGLEDEFPELPLRVLEQDSPGQCTSRNAGLRAAVGDVVLFIDDDDEVGPSLIEDHLETLERYRCQVSSGIAHETGAGPLPEDFRLTRTSDVFPTNNTMIRLKTLHRSGLFDLAYNRSSRADGDLGMRVYLSGALMVLNPEIDVLHHHAPSGGLRTHNARAVTYASSRSRLLHWHISSTSEIYLGMRYFTPRQVREALWLSLLGTFRLKKGGPARKLLKAVIATLRLPWSVYQLMSRHRAARRMLRDFPRIPRLGSAEATKGPG